MDKNEEAYLNNNKEIQTCINNYINENGETPSIKYLSEATGLNRNTITKHIKNIKLSDYTNKFKPPASS